MNFNNIEYTTSFGTEKQITPSTKPEIVFSGRSNVGKSSLMNKLFNRKSLVRVSAKPGKTVTINFFSGDGVWFVDLPGYGYAQTSFGEKQRWSRLMEAYFGSARAIALVVQILDVRHAPSAQDMEMLQFLQESEIPFVIILTKCDKLKPTERKKREAALAEELAAFPDAPRVFFSAENGEGVPALKEVIEQAAQTAQKEGAES